MAGATEGGHSFFAGKAWIVLVVITAAVWLPSVGNDFVSADDQMMIVRNPRFNPPTLASAGWYWSHPAWNLYQPLTTTLWAFLARVGWQPESKRFDGHMTPAFFHGAASLLHLATTVVLFALLLRIFQDEAAALGGALVFAVHPIQTEAIAYAGVINNVLAGLFSFVAIHQYIVVTDPATPEQSKPRGWIIGSVALVAATLAKPSAVVVPPMACVLDWAVHRRPLGQVIRSIFPWALLVCPCLIYTAMFQHGRSGALVPLAYRPVVASDALLFYLRKLVWPVSLCLDYGRTPRQLQARGVGGSVLLMLGALGGAAIFWFRRRPLVLAAIVIFVVGLLPNLGLVAFDWQSISTVSDRYVYLSMAGLALAVAFALRQHPRLLLGLTPALLALVVLTELQIPTWRTPERMARHNLAINPNSWMAENNLAVIIAPQHPAEALTRVHHALALNPQSADAWNTLGILLIGRRDPEAAVNAFEHAQQIEPDNPTFDNNRSRALRAVEASTIQPVP